MVQFQITSLAIVRGSSDNKKAGAIIAILKLPARNSKFLIENSVMCFSETRIFEAFKHYLFVFNVLTSYNVVLALFRLEEQLEFSRQIKLPYL